ncbi:MAG: DUF1343 domain-containing protein [Acidobacteriota bacterium]
MIIETGADRLLVSSRRLAGRQYGLLAHGASVTARQIPLHLALRAAGYPPTALFGPEHGYYGVEQDMVASRDHRDPWTGVPILSLYGDGEHTLRPDPSAFTGLDLLVIDLQDVGSRYYTYIATAIWAAEVALEQGVEVWVLDRPNPLGGDIVEGIGVGAAYHSFVGAFDTPVRHGLTLAELTMLEAKRRHWDTSGLLCLAVRGWRRAHAWPATHRPWIAPSPNMPTYTTAQLYPGGCLIEATTLSEGRGTTRPFQLIGAPGIDPPRLAAALVDHPGVTAIPTYFKPQFQKHAGEVCGGVELVVTEPAIFQPYRFGIHLLATIARLTPDVFAWRAEPYEFVSDRPAIDLLTGGSACREAIETGEGLEEWIASWEEAEMTFKEERRDVLLYL